MMGVFRFQEDNQPVRLMISKKAMKRIVAHKDAVIAGLKHEEQQWIELAEKEKKYINELEVQIKKFKKYNNILMWALPGIGGICGYFIKFYHLL